MVERLAVNQMVAGSSPAPSALFQLGSLSMKFPEPPWSERDLKVVEFLENERLTKEYSIKLAACTNEEDIFCPISGALRKRGAKYYARAIESWRFRNQILREELELDDMIANGYTWLPKSITLAIEKEQRCQNDKNKSDI